METITVPAYKMGDKTDCSNLKGISLFCQVEVFQVVTPCSDPQDGGSIDL